jgi:hypothetical protein
MDFGFEFNKEEVIKELEVKIEVIRNMSNPTDNQVQLGRLYKVMLIELIGDGEE